MKKSYILVVLSVMAAGSLVSAATCAFPTGQEDEGCYECDASNTAKCSACKSGYYYNGMANNRAGMCVK